MFVSVFLVRRHAVSLQVIIVVLGQPGAEPRRLRVYRRAVKVAWMSQRIGDRGRGGAREAPRQFGGQIGFRLDGYAGCRVPGADQPSNVPARIKVYQQLLRVEVVDAWRRRLGVRECDPPVFERVPGRKMPDGVASRVDFRLQGLRDGTPYTKFHTPRQGHANAISGRIGGVSA